MAQRYYTKSHEWLDVDGDMATVGITKHACEQLGDVVFVELPEVGKTHAQGEEVAVVESVKAASDVYTSVSGKIVEVNEGLTDECEILNTDAEASGWIWKMKLSDLSELEGLMDAEAYQNSIS